MTIVEGAPCGRPMFVVCNLLKIRNECPKLFGTMGLMLLREREIEC
jgi:hypothetical protein